MADGVLNDGLMARIHPGINEEICGIQPSVRRTLRRADVRMEGATGDCRPYILDPERKRRSAWLGLTAES